MERLLEEANTELTGQGTLLEERAREVIALEGQLQSAEKLEEDLRLQIEDLQADLDEEVTHAPFETALLAAAAGRRAVAAPWPPRATAGIARLMGGRPAARARRRRRRRRWSRSTRGLCVS